MKKTVAVSLKQDRIIGTTKVVEHNWAKGKTALVADENASFKVIRPDGSFVCEINLFSYEDGRLILDVIDLEDQFTRKTAFTFNKGTRTYLGVDAGVGTISVDLQK